MSSPVRSQLERYRWLEAQRRRLDAEAARVLAEIDRCDAFAVDGHRTAAAFVRHVARCSGPEASARVRVARALDRLPEVAGAASEGAVPGEHLRILGSVAANPRIGELVDGADSFFAEHASHGTVTSLGRRRRLFTGAARDAVIIQDAIDHHRGATCRWPGCHITLSRCQVDHRRSWNLGGATEPSNGQMLCAAHNRLKEHGYTPSRGPDHTWHYTRPDGTPITPAI